MKNFFRRSRRFFSQSESTRTAIPFGRPRRFTHERLEPRMMLTINPSGAEFLVNDTVPGFQGTNDSVVSVAVSETAGTIAAYAGLGAGRREGIFLSRTGGESTTPSVVLASSTIQGQRTAATVAANQAGNTIVVWQGRGAGDKYGIFLQRFDSTGAKVGDEQRVNETRGGTQHDPAVAMAADGSFVITWSGSTAADPAGIFTRRFNADGTAAGSEELVNTTTADDQIESDIAMSSSGDYVITWSSRGQDGEGWGVFGQRFNAAGARQGDEFQLNTTTAASQRQSSVAMQDDGTFIAVWSSRGQDGDNWEIVGRRFDAAGAAVGDEFVVNTTTTGRQLNAQIAGAGGKYLVAWQSGVLGAGGWEIMTQELDTSGNRVGTEQIVNSLIAGTDSGHQIHPAVALNAAGSGSVVWSGYGTTDRRGVFGRRFQDDAPAEDNLTPDLASIANQTVAPNTELMVTVTATDPNAGDTLTYQLDPNNSPTGATIERTDNNTAVIRWTPTDAEQNSVVNFRVLVTDNGTSPLADAETFTATVTDGTVLVDLNGADEAGVDTAVNFLVDRADTISVVDQDLLVTGAQDGTISSATAQLSIIRNAGEETLQVDTLDTNITTSFNTNTRTLTLTGEDTQENYQRVLRTLTYRNTATNPRLTRDVRVRVNDGTEESMLAIARITIGTADPVSLAQDLAAAGVRLLGAAESANNTAQREQFADGGQFLPFVPITNADGSLNQVATENNITDANTPTWIFSDGTRLEGVQTLETLAAQADILIPVSDNPFIAPILDAPLLVGSPLHVPLDGFDPNGGPLTYSVTTSNPNVSASLLSGNRSARVDVAGYGDMVFELFEQRASRPTQRFIDLANDDFYDGIIFHRIINDFVIQGGDPTGTGSGGSTLGDFNDQFHVDLQHNRTGLLSYAKSTDDTNDSQFFITEFTDAQSQSNLRNLDFNHSIFGILVEGEGNRAAISDTATAADDRPVNDVTIENVEIFDDQENAVLFLEAAAGTTGDVMVTVTVTDQQGNTFDRQFTVTVEQDQDDFVDPLTGNRPFDGRPFLADITSPRTIARNTTAQIQLNATDVEGDSFVFGAELPRDRTGALIPQETFNFTVDPGTGLLEVTPPTDFTGTLQIVATVGRTANAADDDQQLISNW